MRRGWDGSGRVVARGWYSYFMHYRAHSISRVSYGGEPAPLIDGIEAHSYRISHAFHLRSYSRYVTAVWWFLLSLLSSFSSIPYISAETYVHVLTLYKNLVIKYTFDQIPSNVFVLQVISHFIWLFVSKNIVLMYLSLAFTNQWFYLHYTDFLFVTYYMYITAIRWYRQIENLNE